MSLSFSDLQHVILDPSWEQWINTSSDDIAELPRFPKSIPLSYLLTKEHSYQGLVSTVEDVLSLSDEITRRFSWICIKGEYSQVNEAIKKLKSLSYEVKLWREHPTKASDPDCRNQHLPLYSSCGALFQKIEHQEKLPSHIDPIKLNGLFHSDPFTKSERWHTRDLFEEEKERQLFLESQKPKRHDPLGIFESDEEPVVVTMNNPFVSTLKPKEQIAKHDPFGIFSSGETPVIVKMTNPFF